MKVHWNLFLGSLVFMIAFGSCDERWKYEEEPPPEFLFEPKLAAVAADCAERSPGMKPPSGLIAGNGSPYARIRKEEITLTRNEVPALTVASDPYNRVNIAGNSGDAWELTFCATGEGDSEPEARENLSKVALERMGNFVMLCSEKY